MQIMPTLSSTATQSPIRFPVELSSRPFQPAVASPPQPTVDRRLKHPDASPLQPTAASPLQATAASPLQPTTTRRLKHPDASPLQATASSQLSPVATRRLKHPDARPLQSAVVGLLLSTVLVACGSSATDTPASPAQPAGDSTPPSLTTFTVSSSAGASATVGDTLTVRLEASESIKQPVVTVNGISDTLTLTGSAASWTGLVTITGVDSAGAITVSARIEDLAGNRVTVSTLTAAAGFTLAVPPTTNMPVQVMNLAVTGSADTAAAPQEGDEIVVHFESDRDLDTPPQVMIGGQLATVAATANSRSSWQATVVVGQAFASSTDGFEIAVVVPGGGNDGASVAVSASVVEVSSTPSQLQAQEATPFLLAPILSYDNTSVTLAVDQLAPTLVLRNAGGNPSVDGCLAESLPPGLSIAPSEDEASCAISGTPADVNIPASYQVSITATNATGASRPLGLHMTIISASRQTAAPELTDVSELTLVVGHSAGVISFVNTAGAPQTDGCTTDQSLPSGLTIAVSASGDSCQISGTPDTPSAQTSYVISATNANGTGTASIAITVTAALLQPALPENGTSATFVESATIAALYIANTGGAVSTCQFVRPNDATYVGFLDGLSIDRAANGRDCEISGLLTGVGFKQFTVRAQNATGSDETPLNITVNPRAPAFAEPSAVVATDGQMIVPLSLTSTGGTLVSCQFIDPADDSETATFDGLNVAVSSSATACDITGTLTGTGLKSFKVRASNVTARVELTLSFTVNPAAPVLQAPSAQSYATGAAVSFDMTNTGGGQLSGNLDSPPGCAVDTPLPTGLSLAVSTDGNTCTISGTPETTQTASDYIITATNASASASATVSIAVVSGIASFAAPSPLTYIVGTDIGEQIFANTNTDAGRVTGCVASLLPTGLQIAAQDSPGNGCVLTGTPNTVTAQANYTVTATNANGDSTVMLDITINPVAPALQTPSAQSYATGAAVSFDMTNTGGGQLSGNLDSPPGCAVDTPLPTGLSLAVSTDGNTCTISGTPETTQAASDYIITATNASASASATVSIAVVSGIASFAVQTPLIYIDGTDIGEQIFANTNTDAGRVTSCVASLLPTGLQIAAQDSPSNGCVLTGTPNTVTAQANYTVTATNANGDSTLTLDITVNPVAPALQTPSAQSYATGAAVSFDMTNTGGGQLNGDLDSPPGCAVDTPLPTGLSLAVSTDGNTCTISGTPETTQTASDYIITATNATANATATVSIAVVSGIASFAAQTPLIYIDGTDIGEQIFANTNTDAGRVTSCVASLLPTGLQIAAQDSPGNGCVLTGTPNTVTAQANYTVTATNDNGDSTLMLDITINPVAPALQTPSAQSFATGAAVNFDLTNTGGGHLNGNLDSPPGCAVDTPLPTGLSLAVSTDGNTCTISGTSETAQSATDYVITATNATANATATVSIAVVSGIAAFATPSPLTYIVGTDIGVQVFANTNTDAGRVTSCTASLLPTGLQIAAQDSPGNGCVLTGTPNTVTAQATYTITVTNDNGDSTLTLDITVNPAAPALQTPSAQSYATGAAVSFNMTNTGGGHLNGDLDSPPGCAVDTALPAGLSLAVSADDSTCTITGTPDTAQSASDYIITATNVTASASATVSIAVVSGIASFAAQTPLIYIDGTDIVEQTFANTNTGVSRVTSCTATALSGIALPSGLQIAAQDSPGNGCVLTGTPDTVTAQAAYTITVTNDNGNSTLTLDITVNPVAPALQMPVAQSYTTGAAVNFDLTNTGGGHLNGALDSPAGCVVDTPLPAGLSLTVSADDSTCTIAGTPEATQAASDYIITATNATADSSATVSIAIVSGVADFADPGLLTYTDGTDIVEQTFANTNSNTDAGRVTSCTASLLPSGLQIAAQDSPGNSCVLTGTPNTVTAQATYTITVTNDNGNSTLTLDITVNPAAPALQTPSAQSYATGAAVNFDLTNTGGGHLNGALDSPAGCVVDTPLPVGLSLAVSADDSTCTIAGTPETTQAASDYIITATNATADSSATVSIAIVSGVADFADPGPLTYTDGTDIVEQTFANTNTNAGRVTSCTATALSGIALPSGLQIAAQDSPGNGCVLTGTPDTVTAQAAYTITVTNDNGDSTLTLDITVNPAAPALQTPSAQSYTTGAAVNFDLTNTGGGHLNGALDSPAGCVVDTPLPVGLSLAVSADDSTCTIAGTPEATQAASDYIITATNATADSSATVSIAIVSGVADFADPGPLTYTDGTDIVEQTFANTNTNAGRVTSCTAPLLPTGLQIAAQDSPGNSCVLTGTPNTVTAQATYTITVTNDNGNSTLTLDITVNPAAPALQTPSAQSYATGAAVSLDLTNTGGGQLNGALDSPAGCVVDTPLPVGLSLAVSADDSTCTIAGTPESAQAANDYTITATNVTASSSATVSIAVVSGVATFTAQTPITYTAGTVVVEQTFANTNTDAGRVTSCTASLLPTGLQIAAQDSPGNGCVVTGTPAAATALANYSVTVSNENGDSTLTLAITVNPAAPVLQTPSAQSYATGAAVSLDLTNTGGGQLNGALDSPPGCIVNTPLPAGLSLTVSADGNTCTIAGTPETTQAASDYSIAATNATNSVSVTVNITVVSGIAAFATPVPYTYIVGVDTVEQTFANTNTNAGRVTNCTATSQFGIVLPAGLQIAALDSPGNGCILTGTPITATAQAAYTITVTNDNGDSTLPIDITINPDTPILPAMSTTFFITGAEGNFEMANTGGGLPNGAGISPSSCAVNTALPAGLNLTITSDDHTCRIFGTPETAQAARDYIVTATNVTGSSLSTVSITIVSGTAAFTDPGPLTYTDGTDILQQTFANTNTNARRVTNCAATPPSGIALPAGLQVAALGSPGNGCVLTGTPNTVTAQAAYTITVTNDNGTSTLTLDITVNPAAPALQTPSAQSYASGAAVSFDLSNTGGGQLNDALASPPGCVVDTPLPAGLSLTVAADDSTCTLAGTPETTQTASDYVITATNATASSSATVSITVVSGTAAFADPGLLIYTDGTDIVEQTFANTNTDAGRVTNCTATPPSGIALPAGLQITALDSPSNGCVLTGTPNTVTAQAAYTITVTNDNGTSTLTLDITVNPAAPALQTPSAQSYTSGAAVSFDLSNTGGGQLNDALDSPPGCVVNTPLPAGLSLAVSADDSTCTLAGTPETAQTANDYVITATNATASSSATVSISVVSGTAAFADPGSLIYTVGTNVLTQTFANTNTDAGRVTSCTATPLSGIALPAGLQIIALGSPGNGCVLTGTPSAITAQAAYTITVTNDNGTSTLTLDITVNPAAPVLTVPVAQTVATGDEVVLTLVNTGGNPETCTTSSTLPDGLTVGMDNSGQTCQLSGTVDQEAALQMYTVAVRAANVSGDSTAVVQITVVLAAPVLTTPGAISVGEGESLLAQTLNSSAGRPSQCVFIDLGAEEGMMEVANHHGLNARVSDNGAGCTIVGDPFGAPGEVNYILRAINDAGFSEVTITITITTSAPVFGVASQAITATAGLVLIPNVLTTTGSVPESCFFAGIDNNEIAPPAGLAVTRATPLRGCLFSGSLADVGTYTYTVRAANSAGGDNISVEITVNPAVPSLPTGPLSYIAIDGQSINSAHIANTGGDIESGGCQFLEIVNEELTPIANQGDLPLTLTSFATGCTLSGTLTGTGTQSFIIGAQNVSGDDSVVVDFTVNPPPPSLPTMTTVGEAVDGATIAPLSIANSGGAADSCAFLDNTPAAVNTLDGLSIAVNLDGSACTITGTLTGTGQYTYTVRATNASGSDDALVTFTVSAAVPALATPAMQVYPTGEGASLELTNNGGGQLNTLSDSPPGCAVDAELPSGLALVVSADESTCTIFGTPDTVQAATNYIITATNDTGSATATANIEIVSGAPIFADAGTLVYTDGDTVSESLANSNIFGGLVSDCSAVDTLPAGLTITALVSPSNGCSLTGTVSGTAAQDTYDITATNDNGETTLTLDISVLAALPDLPTLPASAIMVEAVDGVAINTITVANTGGVADSCAFVAGMPSSPTETANLDGLSIAVNLDGSACTIDGALTGTGEVNYTVRASNASGSDDAVVSFTVNPTAPALATPAMQVYPTGEGVSLELTNNGGGLLYSLSDLTPGCAVDATLPSGLSLAVSADENTCIIIGTPDTVQAATDYTITATNATGSATATANIEIVSGAPMFAAPGALVYTDGDTANESLANINIYGGDVTDCSAVDTLPTGLIIAALASSSNGCSITGTVSGTAAQDDYDITVSNDNGQTTLTLNITVNAAPPAVPELPDSATMVEAVDGVAINTVTVANTGAAADSCYFVTGMPSSPSETANLDGLSIAANVDGSACTIDGTLTGTGAIDYTVRASNATGSDDAVVSFTVNPTAPDLETPNEQIYATGEEASLELINNGGGQINSLSGSPAGCISDVALPSGLSLAVSADESTCTITGTPDTAQISSPYTIVATNATGISTTVVDITIVSGAPFFAATDALVYTDGDTVSEILVNINIYGGDVTDCSAVDTLPAGLTIAALSSPADGCGLTGAVSGTATEDDYDITVSNDNGQTTLTLNITVNAASPDLPEPPVLPDATTMVEAVDGVAINTVTVTNSGGAVDSCFFVEPVMMDETLMLNGLSIAVAVNGNDCVLSGTLTGVGTQTFTVRAINATSSDEADVEFTVYAADLTVLSAAGTGTGHTLSVLTSAAGNFSDSVETTGSMDSAKMIWALNSNSGELTVNITDADGAAVLLTRLDPAVDLSAYAQGELVFDILVNDYTAIDAMFVRIDCTSCSTSAFSLDAPGEGGWETVRVPVSALVNNGVNLAQVSTGIVIFPDTAQQDKQIFEFSIRNIRWTSIAGQ